MFIALSFHSVDARSTSEARLGARGGRIPMKHVTAVALGPQLMAFDGDGPIKNPLSALRQLLPGTGAQLPAGQPPLLGVERP
jgi:hypothetical protein